MLKNDRPSAVRRAIADTVHRALVGSLGIPEGDRFQIVGSHGHDLIYDPGFLGMERTDDVVFVQVFMAVGRSVEQKALFRALADGLAAGHGRSEDDVFVNLVELAREIWSFGRASPSMPTPCRRTWPPHRRRSGSGRHERRMGSGYEPQENPLLGPDEAFPVRVFVVGPP